MRIATQNYHPATVHLGAEMTVGSLGKTDGTFRGLSGGYDTAVNVVGGIKSLVKGFLI